VGLDLAEKSVAMATSLGRIEKPTPGRSSTTAFLPTLKNLAKISPVDVQIIGLTEIVKKRNSSRT